MSILHSQRKRSGSSPTGGFAVQTGAFLSARAQISNTRNDEPQAGLLTVGPKYNDDPLWPLDDLKSIELPRTSTSDQLIEDVDINNIKNTRKRGVTSVFDYMRKGSSRSKRRHTGLKGKANPKELAAPPPPSATTGVRRTELICVEPLNNSTSGKIVPDLPICISPSRKSFKADYIQIMRPHRSESGNTLIYDPLESKSSPSPPDTTDALVRMIKEAEKEPYAAPTVKIGGFSMSLADSMSSYPLECQEQLGKVEWLGDSRSDSGSTSTKQTSTSSSGFLSPRSDYSVKSSRPIPIKSTRTPLIGTNRQSTKTGRSISDREINYGSPETLSPISEAYRTEIRAKLEDDDLSTTQVSESGRVLIEKHSRSMSRSRSETITEPQDKSLYHLSGLISKSGITTTKGLMEISPKSASASDPKVASIGDPKVASIGDPKVASIGDLTFTPSVTEVWESIVVIDAAVVVIQYRCNHTTGEYIKGFLGKLSRNAEGAAKFLLRIRGFRKNNRRIAMIAMDLMNTAIVLNSWLISCTPTESLANLGLEGYDIISYISGVLKTERELIKKEYQVGCADGSKLPENSVLRGLLDSYPAIQPSEIADRQAQLFCNVHAKVHGYTQPFKY